ncbi:ADP-ribosylglycohydrolase family protein [Magnetococcales bacterium HHB-1]
MHEDQQFSLIGSLMGTMVGDALGLPFEGLSPKRARKLFPDPEKHHLLFFNRGMISDDTEHSAMVAQALLHSQGEPDRFQKTLAWRLRGWFFSLPAGIGLATLRSIIKLWLGFSPDKSGVFSAGNGPAMRSPILGVYFKDHPEKLTLFIRHNTRITHTDIKAEQGAMAVALAAAISANQTLSKEEIIPHFLKRLHDHSDLFSPQEGLQEFTKIITSVQQQQSTQDYAKSLGLEKGVTGYVRHSVFVALHAWLSHPEDYRQAILSTILCGGDTDTTAAITGGIVGARVGEEGIPKAWIEGITDWPRSKSWIRKLSKRLADPKQKKPLPLAWYGIPLRSIFFMGVVLFHGFRRLFPPYG